MADDIPRLIATLECLPPAGIRRTLPAGRVRADACREALEKLVRIGEAAVPALLRALGHSRSAVRVQAAEALGRIGSPAAVGLLCEALEDDSSEVREEAARALGLLGRAEAVPDLCAALQRPAPLVRVAAAEALGRIALRDPTAALLPAIPTLKRFASPWLLFGADIAVYRQALVRVREATAPYQDLPRPAAAPPTELHELPRPAFAPLDRAGPLVLPADPTNDHR